MNDSNFVTTVLVVILVLILGFFLFNNAMHVGFHVGHDNDQHESGGMMSGHDDGGHGHDDGDDDSVASYEIYPGDVADKIHFS